MAQGRGWSRDEVARAVALYVRTPFGRLHARNPDVVALAAALSRTPGAVALKLVNLATLDETVARRGMANASRLDREVWTEFLRDPAALLESVASRVFPTGVESPAGAFGEGFDVVVEATARRGQEAFRDLAPAAHDLRCAVTGLDDARLLVASHVKGWAEAPMRRMDPSDGLCLNALHDRAFDRGLISFDEDWRVMVSPGLAPEARGWFARPEHGALRMPTRFRPSAARMAAHRARHAANFA